MPETIQNSNIAAKEASHMGRGLALELQWEKLSVCFACQVDLLTIDFPKDRQHCAIRLEMTELIPSDTRCCRCNTCSHYSDST